jgi:CMP-N-acetylneuraminic acid synthetase
MNSLNILGIIPARANSKGVLHKNIKLLDDKPLISYTINSANNSRKLSDFVITTDSEIILKHFGGIKRPDDLTQDDTPMMPVIKHTLTEYEKINGKVDAICLLQPTSPLRTSDDIDSAIDIFSKLIISKSNKSLYSGYYINIKNQEKVFNKKLNIKHFQRNGAIFIATRDLIVNEGKLWDKNVFNFEMPAWRSVDIDTYEDFTFVEILLKGGALGK